MNRVGITVKTLIEWIALRGGPEGREMLKNREKNDRVSRKFRSFSRHPDKQAFSNKHVDELSIKGERSRKR